MFFILYPPICIASICVCNLQNFVSANDSKHTGRLSAKEDEDGSGSDLEDIGSADDNQLVDHDYAVLQPELGSAGVFILITILPFKLSHISVIDKLCCVLVFY